MASEQGPTPPDDLDDLPAVQRDWGFLVRLILALLVGGIAAAFLAAKIKSGAAGCGSGLIRPGSTVVPAESPQSNTPSAPR